jgi:hypothetical protein
MEHTVAHVDNNDTWSKEKQKKVRDFHVRRLRIRMFSQSLVCVHRTDLGSWLHFEFFFLHRFSRFHLIYLFVCVFCLSGTWLVFMSEIHKLPYSS